jgi:hypothetical protein
MNHNLVKKLISTTLVMMLFFPKIALADSLCKVDYTDPNVSFVSQIGESIISEIYRMDFIAGELCSHLDELVSSTGISVFGLSAYSLEFEALKTDIDAKSSASYVDFAPYPVELPSYRITLSETNRRYIANFLNTKRLLINKTSVAGDSYTAIRRAACRSVHRLHNAIYYMAACK